MDRTCGCGLTENWYSCCILYLSETENGGIRWQLHMVKNSTGVLCNTVRAPPSHFYGARVARAHSRRPAAEPEDLQTAVLLLVLRWLSVL